MTKTLFALLIAVTVAGVALVQVPVAQELPLPPEDYPGQREHKPPPPGYYCAHNHPNPKQSCSCVRLDTSENCEGTPTEDRLCKSWCFRAACRCPVKCMPAEPPELPYPDAPEDDHESHVPAPSGMHAH